LGSHLLIKFFYGRCIWILARSRNARTENIGTYAPYSQRISVLVRFLAGSCPQTFCLVDTDARGEIAPIAVVNHTSACSQRLTGKQEGTELLLVCRPLVN
jgi:hypothetical protein